MKRYIKSDINSYSYTGPGFADDRITLATSEYAIGKDYGYIELVKDSYTCYVSSESYYTDQENYYYKEYPMSDIKSAIADFNRLIDALGGDSHTSIEEVDEVLAEYNKSIADYLPGGFYDNLRNNK